MTRAEQTITLEMYFTGAEPDAVEDGVYDALVECLDASPEIEMINCNWEPGIDADFLEAEFKAYIDGEYSYTPARLYLANGDPGYPAEEDFDSDEIISKADLDVFRSEMTKCCPHIEIDDVSIYVDDYEIDYDSVDDYYEGD